MLKLGVFFCYIDLKNKMVYFKKLVDLFMNKVMNCVFGVIWLNNWLLN